MKSSLYSTPRPAALRALAAAVALGAAAAAQAQLTDLSNVPLQTSVSTTVRPNLMYILDASGSMASDYLPDYVNDSVGGSSKAYCRDDNSPQPPASDNDLHQCERGDVPYYAAAFNGNYYNPQVTYLPPPMPAGWTGTNFVSQTAAATANWTQVFQEPFISPGTKTNIATAYRELYACSNNSYSGGCKRNGIDTPNPFNYWTQGLPNTSSSTDTRVTQDNTGPHYYDIIPQEYCSDLDLVNCVAATAPILLNVFPAYVRFCQTRAQSTQVATPSGGTPPLCIGKYVNQGTGTTWRYARYGTFQRVNIVSTTPTYGNRPSRSDCTAAPTCTYAEEMTNFANWYAYYRTRMQMMKTATGHAFIDLDDRYRIGFITIRPGNDVNNPATTGNPVNSARFQPVATFDNAQKLVFFQKLYAQTSGSFTPLREALSRVGRYFAKRSDGINTGMNTGSGLDKDPVQYSCQQNFALLTTDGYWNTEEGRNLSSGSMASTNVDNTNAGYAQRADAAYDGNVAGSSGTLADVALYYYQNDLRTTALGNCTSGSTGLDVCGNNVPTSPADVNDTQHMTTFTLGLVDGLMRYQTDYDTAGSSDVAKIKGSSTGCPWSPTAICNWPVPGANLQSAIDDLWHAAVNGRGRYYNARDPETLSFGLKNALSNVVAQVAAAAAAATSTPNINQFDNLVFSSTYRTVTWDGEVIARNIDPATGNVLPTVVWSAQGLLDAQAPATRKIYVRNGTSVANFDFATLPAATLGFFTNKCSLLSQCTDLSAAQQIAVNDGTTLVNYLRGDKTNEPDLFRQRDHILGDTVNAVPAYVSKPLFQFADSVAQTYGDFKAAQASRTPMLYVGANDGMLHAFNGSTGQEVWAFVPTMVMANMHLLADKNYAIKHTYFVDGQVTVMDAFFAAPAGDDKWHTVLVGGLNKGGSGYYALDITNPAVPPVPLWEFCTDSTLCTSSDPNIGFTYGNPVITKRPDGKWVALLTSGYNNADGQGWLYVVDLQTGALLDQVSTLAGTPGTPSGLSKITALANNFTVDNTVIAAYVGDLLGNLWKFDMSAMPPTVKRLAQLTDPGGATQPITTRPEITRINSELVLYVTTGEYLGASDLAVTQIQTVYAFKDTDTDHPALRTQSGMKTNIPVVNPDGSVSIPSGFNVNWVADLGWYVDLPRAGERVNIDPQLIQGTLLVVSNKPDTNACSTGGESFFYQFDYANPTAVSSSTNGTTLGVKIGSAVAVGLTVIKLPSGAVKALIPTADTKIQTFGVNLGGGSVSTRRIGWRQLF